MNVNVKPVMTVKDSSGNNLPSFKIANLTHKDTELSEEQKAKAILAINEKLQKDILLLKWEDLKVEKQNAEEIIKIAEEKEKARVKSVEWFYDEIDKRIKASEVNVKKYQAKRYEDATNAYKQAQTGAEQKASQAEQQYGYKQTGLGGLQGRKVMIDDEEAARQAALLAIYNLFELVSL